MADEAPEVMPRTDTDAIINQISLDEHRPHYEVAEEVMQARHPETQQEASSPEATAAAVAAAEASQNSERSSKSKRTEQNVASSPSSRADSDASSTASAKPPDPYNIRRRFVRAHRRDFPEALHEIQTGRKRSCWSWYVFPVDPWVVRGIERGSYTNREYALRDLPPNDLCGDDAARAYLRFPTTDGVNLRQNLIDIYKEVTVQVRDKGISSVELVGFLDDPKMRSSLRLFERVTRDGFDDEVHAVVSECMRVIKEKPAGSTPSCSESVASTLKTDDGADDDTDGEVSTAVDEYPQRSKSSAERQPSSQPVDAAQDGENNNSDVKSDPS